MDNNPQRKKRMKRILFVDDDVNTLNGLRRGLYSMRDEWRLEFEENAEDALRLLANNAVDVIVTDVQMSEMDGFQLLGKARKTCPQAVRIVLSGQTQQDQLARSFQSMHLFLSKPCDMQILKRRIRQVLSYGDKIADRSVKSLVSQLGVLPSLPILAGSLRKEFQSPNPCLDEIAGIVAMDMGMSASVLHLANSGCFGPNLPMSSPELAVRWLGLETVRSFLITNGLCATLDLNGFKHFDAEALWRDSVARATESRALALAQSGNAVFADEAFAAGLFRDLGQVVLATVLRSSYDDIVCHAMLRGEPLWKVEREFIGSTHAEVGAYLLALWGFPEPVLDAVLSRRSQAESQAELGKLTAAHKA
jgi:HD-like signal output (HDOD) protein/CheY-like chemotaxis protein